MPKGAGEPDASSSLYFHFSGDGKDAKAGKTQFQLKSTEFRDNALHTGLLGTPERTIPTAASASAYECRRIGAFRPVSLLQNSVSGGAYYLGLRSRCELAPG